MILPDYQGGSIVNLMSSLVMGLGAEDCIHPPLRELAPTRLHEPTNVVFLVIDGMGLHTLNTHAAGGVLHRHLAGEMTSVFPSTTASAITTFLTGEAPRQHGLTGWHMYLRELASVIAVLPGTPRYGGVPYGKAGVDVARLLGHRPVFDRLMPRSYVIAPTRIAQSDFNRAHQGKADLRAYGTLDEMFKLTERTLREHAARKYLYVYWPELDHLGHVEGIEHPATLAHLHELDEAFAKFMDRIRGSDTLVIVTADHGQIDTTEETNIDLSDHPELADCLLLPLCGERRAPYCYVRPEHRERFEQYVLDELEEFADLYASRDLVEAEWFGAGKNHPRLLERVGDYTLVMKQGYTLKDWLPQEPRYEQVGVHGGVSEREMRVPLVLAEA